MSVSPGQIEKAVSEALDKFHEARIEKLKSLNLQDLLKRKNPYLFRGKGITVAADVMKEIVMAFMSSSEETLFGNIFFEEVALVASGGQKALADSIDIVIHTKDSVKAVAVKSGPHVFNSQSKRRQKDAFEEMRKRLTNTRKYFDPIVGYGYGRKRQSKGSQSNFREIAGQAFWEEMTGDTDFYLKIARLMKEKPQNHAEKYHEVYGATINRLTKEFTESFCNEDGVINWDEWIRVNSGK